MRAAFTGFLETLGPAHDQTVEAAGMLSSLYERLGRPNDAESVRRALRP